MGDVGKCIVGCKPFEFMHFAPMSKAKPVAFLAYPSQDALIAETLSATEALSQDERIEIFPWPKLAPIGLKIDDLIRDELGNADFLIADTTEPNFNVYYEIGFAIAKQKPIMLTVFNGKQNGDENARLTGLFDTIGWAKYDNSAELIIQSQKWKKVAWVERYKKPRDFSQPLFVLDLFVKNNFRQYIFEAIKRRSVNFRSFDPLENPTLSTANVVAEISASSGCILPFVRNGDRDFLIHNLRVGFIAGVAHGFEIDPLLIQYDQSPTPIDYRDFIKNTKGQTETHRHVEDYCAQVLIQNQRASNRAETLPLSILGQIEVGNASAENEAESLDEYFIETAEFRRAERTDQALIIGRKGSGKTAILNQLKRRINRKRDTAVIELRPATHDLSEMRYQILEVTNQGIFDHTVASFWQYILYMEILLCIREMAIDRMTNDFDLQNRIRVIEDDFDLTDNFVAADFTSRLAEAIDALIDGIKGDEGLTIEEFTNFMFETKIPRLRDAIVDLSDQYDEIYILFDDLDKGWPPQQLENHDIMLIRHLVESFRRIQRELRRREIAFKGKLFLRSDVYETLVDVTSDRNKDVVIRVDWTEKDQLVSLIKRRATHKFPRSEHERIWQAFNPVLADGKFAIDKLIEGSLYRPRFLIDLCEMMLAIAINRDANYIEDDDVEKALRQFSKYLVSEWGLELRDTSGIPRDIFYYFIGKPEILTRDELGDAVKTVVLSISLDELIDLFLWYGFLGIAKSDEERIFIFDCGYDFRRLQVHHTKDSDTLYCVNKAFLRGLEIQ